MDYYIIVDIDGTIADCSHRLHHLKTNNWDAFFSDMDKDSGITQTLQLIDYFRDDGYIIVLCSARPEKYRAATIKWLDDNWVRYHALYMRPDDDHRADYIVKREIFKEIRNVYGQDPFLVVDDRNQVIDGCWLPEGQTVFQVRQPGVKDINVDERARLFLMVGPSGAGKSTWLKHASARYHHNIQSSDIVSTDQTRFDMTGSRTDQNRNNDVFDYVYRFVATRLKFGMTAVVDATNIKRKDRIQLTELTQGICPIHYIVVNRPMEDKIRDAGWRLNFPGLLERHENTFNSNLKDILKGDGLPNVTVHDERL